MDRLRTPFLIAAIVLFVFVVLIETGSQLYIGESSNSLPAPGIGIPYLGLVDGIVLFTLALFGLSLIVPARLLGAIHGIVTFVLMLFLLLGGILLIFVALALLIMMVTLLLAVPFGTLAYFAAYADFDLAPARATLGVIMLLKVAACICLFLAQEHLIQVKGLVLLLLTSLLASIVVSFLHGIVPGFLVSILDAIAAIVVGVLAVIWALIKLIGAIPAIVKAIRGIGDIATG